MNDSTVRSVFPINQFLKASFSGSSSSFLRGVTIDFIYCCCIYYSSFSELFSMDEKINWDLLLRRSFNIGRGAAVLWRILGFLGESAIILLILFELGMLFEKIFLMLNLEVVVIEHEDIFKSAFEISQS